MGELVILIDYAKQNIQIGTIHKKRATTKEEMLTLDMCTIVLWFANMLVIIGQSDKVTKYYPNAK